MQVRSVELLHEQVDRFQSMLSDLLEISRFDAGSAMLTIDTEDFVFSNILGGPTWNVRIRSYVRSHEASWWIWTVYV